jgi:hypothetical protein
MCPNLPTTSLPSQSKPCPFARYATVAQGTVLTLQLSHAERNSVTCAYDLTQRPPERRKVVRGAWRLSRRAARWRERHAAPALCSEQVTGESHPMNRRF